ncbi:MAG: ATP-dependent 6-phosphofructokinase [Acidobacteria bacterium]|nr:ATP-dependent 6-phosphofructokinase [Acidobacteriota bacterium]MBI3658424.1 ATP-dependent 6-phosphofructokinase [Acidobacteriota bacterium]
MIKTRRLLIATGGGDCPGLNAVIRAIVKKAVGQYSWEVIGSINAFNGVLMDPMELKPLDLAAVSGIHVKGGTILGTTNRCGPFQWPVERSDGSWELVDRSGEMIERLGRLGIDAVINIGGDGSQLISQRLFEQGLNIIGVPKTIDNDLSATDFTFGYQTAVEVVTDAVDKLVTTASSHHRIMVLEVMGRDAGWIALGAAVAGGADVALIPEIPYRIGSVMTKISERIQRGRGFAIVIVAEGARAVDGDVIASQSEEVGYQNKVLGGVGRWVAGQIKEQVPDLEIRLTVLGHLQRGGIPCAFDRILATQFGVAAVEAVKAEIFGHMVAYRHPDVVTIPIKEAISQYNHVGLNSNLIKTARGLNICLGD